MKVDVNLILYFFSFILLLIAIFNIFNFVIPKVNFKTIKKEDIENKFSKLEKNIFKIKSKFNADYLIYNRVKKRRKKKKNSAMKELLNDFKAVFLDSSRKWVLSKLFFSTLLMLLIAVILGVYLDSYLITLTLGIFLMLIPIISAIFSSYKRKREINNELETALSIITNSYMRNNNISLAVEENIDYINEPIREVFLGFMLETKYVYSDTKIALDNMKGKINSSVFHDWIDSMIACSEDKDLKSTLIPTIMKLSDMRMVASELDTLMFNPLKEFILVVVMYFISILAIYYINRNWWHILINTSAGKIYLSISFLIVSFCLIQVVRLTRPVEYKR